MCFFCLCCTLGRGLLHFHVWRVHPVWLAVFVQSYKGKPHLALFPHLHDLQLSLFSARLSPTCSMPSGCQRRPLVSIFIKMFYFWLAPHSILVSFLLLHAKALSEGQEAVYPTYVEALYSSSDVFFSVMAAKRNSSRRYGWRCCQLYPEGLYRFLFFPDLFSDVQRIE